MGRIVATSFKLLAAAGAVAAAVAFGPLARAFASPAPVKAMLQSEQPSGNPTVDRIPVEFHPASTAAGERSPAVVLLHPLGTKKLTLMRRFARYLADRGIGAAIMTLPYHMQRLPSGEKPGRRFVAHDVHKGVQALGQSAADVSTVAAWLREQPSVDPERVGTVGVSLGAVVAHLAMGKDETLSAGVALLGGGNLPYLRRRSTLFNFPTRAPPLDAKGKEMVRSVDPLTFAENNRARQVLMVEAARDIVVPPHCARDLWKALDHPPIRWIDTGHYGLFLGAPSAMAASAAYLKNAWSDSPKEDRGAPRVSAPTIKAGVLFGLDSIATPALQWQAYTFLRRRDQMSLLHGDLGWSGRGPFIGLAATLNAYLDAGIAHRFGGSIIRPYASLHVVF